MKLFSTYSKIVKPLLNLLFPGSCFGCNALLSGEAQTLCFQCVHELPFTEQNLGERPVFKAYFFANSLVVAGCSFLQYKENSTESSLLKQLKFRGHFWLSKWLGQRLLPFVPDYPIDVVVPIPLHPFRLYKRGYNQVSGFAEVLASHFDAEIVAKALKVGRYSKSQTRGGKVFRQTNRRNYFRLHKAELLKGKRILLVDDILTSGATMDAAITCIARAEVSEIYWMTLAWTPQR
jgi:ComF family protein